MRYLPLEMTFLTMRRVVSRSFLKIRFCLFLNFFFAVVRTENLHRRPIGRVHEEAKIHVREARERVAISHRMAWSSSCENLASVFASSVSMTTRAPSARVAGDASAARVEAMHAPVERIHGSWPKVILHGNG